MQPGKLQKSFLYRQPVFLILLPVFFVFHGFTENYNSIPSGDALFLTLIYIAVSIVIAAIFYLIYRNTRKAAFITFSIMAFHFFFGAMQDFLRNHFEGSFLSRYIFILPSGLIIFIMLLILLKKRDPITLQPYLNILLAVIILTDVVWLLSKMNAQLKENQMLAFTNQVHCDSCKSPDIYFVILDGYSGNSALIENFNFDNSGFENELDQLGFYVTENSISNYNYTPFSIASVLNAAYLRLNMETKGPGNLNNSYLRIRNNRVVNFLESYHYQFYNYSIFNFADIPSTASGNFLRARTQLITSQTFLSRLWKDIVFNVETRKWKIRPLEKKLAYAHLENNNNSIRKMLETASTGSPYPKFIYTHLMMPHYPYYYNSKGQPMAFEYLLQGQQYNKKNYVEYLQYCNQKIVQFTNTILKASSAPPVIILAGDHGFRQKNKDEDRKYCFSNLMAVYLPTGDYSNFYTGMSLVNLFPAVFNSVFDQEIPVLKDSTVYLWE